ncbi:unnamed protein product [Arctogadus glacialis]
METICCEAGVSQQLGAAPPIHWIDPQTATEPFSGLTTWEEAFRGHAERSPPKDCSVRSVGGASSGGRRRGRSQFRGPASRAEPVQGAGVEGGAVQDAGSVGGARSGRAFEGTADGVSEGSGRVSAVLCTVHLFG